MLLQDVLLAITTAGVLALLYSMKILLRMERRVLDLLTRVEKLEEKINKYLEKSHGSNR